MRLINQTTFQPYSSHDAYSCLREENNVFETLRCLAAPVIPIDRIQQDFNTIYSINTLQIVNRHSAVT